MTYRKESLDKAPIIGECEDMCPKKEFYQHTQGIVSPFEVDPNTNQFKESLAITTYHRSEAQKQYSPEEIRPLPILQKTMNHILTYIIGQRLNTSESTNEINLYHYLRDRFRAIAMEINIQSLTGQPAINIYQTIALFFIWAGGRFPNKYDLSDFDGNQNQERLSDILLSLNALYLQYFKSTGRHSQLEPEFRAFSLLIYLSNSDEFQSRLQLIPPDLLQTEPIKTVLALRIALISKSITDFLKILDSTSIQFSIMAIQSCRKFYFNAFLLLRQSIGSFKFPKQFFTSFLDLREEDFRYYADVFHLQKIESAQGDLYQYPKMKPNDLNPQLRTMPSRIQQRLDQCSIIDFLQLTPLSTFLPPRPIEVPKPIPVVLPPTPIRQPSPIREIKKENLIENVVVKVKEEKPTVEMKPLSRTNSFRDEEQIIVPKEESIKQIEVHELKVLIKMRKKLYRPNLFRFESMLPPSFPQFCFISIVVNDADGSPSAVYARDCLKNVNHSNSFLEDNKNIIYLNHFEVDSFGHGHKRQTNHVYLSIVRKPLQKYLNSVGCVLHCEDTNDFHDELPCFTFSIDKCPNAPDLHLNDLIRKCIRAAINPFEPLDLTLLIKSALQNGLDIANSPNWEDASANSILVLLNSILNTMAKLFISEKFMQYLLPFIHMEITYKDMETFSNLIRKSKFKLIDSLQSTTPKIESSWGYFLRQNLQVKTFTPFIAPVSCTFNPDKFVDLALDPYYNRLPSEYIIHPDNTYSGFSLLNAFDQVLYE